MDHEEGRQGREHHSLSHQAAREKGKKEQRGKGVGGIHRGDDERDPD